MSDEKHPHDYNFNPNSVDAQFATILQRLSQQDRLLVEIRDQTTKTNGRVTKVERIIAGWKAWVAGASFCVLAIVEAVRIWLKL